MPLQILVSWAQTEIWSRCIVGKTNLQEFLRKAYRVQYPNQDRPFQDRKCIHRSRKRISAYVIR